MDYFPITAHHIFFFFFLFIYFFYCLLIGLSVIILSLVSSPLWLDDKPERALKPTLQLPSLLPVLSSIIHLLLLFCAVSKGPVMRGSSESLQLDAE